MSIPTAPPRIQRHTITFKIPAGSRHFPGDPASVTFQPLTAREEIDAARSAISTGGGTDVALTHELVRRSVVAVDGKPVNWGVPGTSEVGPEWVDGTSRATRSLLGRGFLRVHESPKTDEADFLASAVENHA